MTIAETQGKRTPMFIADDFELNTLHCTRKNLEKQHTPRFSGKLVSPENKLCVTCKRSRSPDYNYVGHSVGPSCWLKKGGWSDGTTREREKRRPRQITKKRGHLKLHANCPLNFLGTHRQDVGQGKKEHSGHTLSQGCPCSKYPVVGHNCLFSWHSSSTTEYWRFFSDDLKIDV